jgi:hypothetical protein
MGGGVPGAVVAALALGLHAKSKRFVVRVKEVAQKWQHHESRTGFNIFEALALVQWALAGAPAILPRWQVTMDFKTMADKDNAVPVGLPLSHLILLLGLQNAFRFRSERDRVICRRVRL